MPERVKVFFASSSELKDEREKCIYIANKLRKAHEHLDIDPVLWEHDMTHSSFPGSTNIQDAITNSELKDSPVVVFLFHSKIGQYTREEFDYATANKKKVFVYFKDGFSPEEEHMQAYSELLQFKTSLNSRVLYESFKDLVDFENKMFANLNLFFSQQYRTPANTTAMPSADIKSLMMQMMQEMKTQKNSDHDNGNEQIAELQAEIKRMREQLFAGDEAAKSKHEKAKHELEAQLSKGEEGNETLMLALEQIEEGNYDLAENYLLQRVDELMLIANSPRATDKTIDELAGAYYQLGRTRELEFDYEGALVYYQFASETLPEVAEYKVDIARIAVELGMWDEALRYYDEILPTIAEGFGENSLEVADIYLGMSSCFASQDGGDDNVIAFTEGAVDILRSFGIKEDQRLIIPYNNLAFAYSMKGDFNKAVSFGKKAIGLSKKYDGEENSFLPFYYQTLGNIYDTSGDYEQAIDLHSKALDVHLLYYPEDDASTKLFYTSYASTCRMLGAFDEAINTYTLALNIAQNHPSNDGWSPQQIQQCIKDIKKEKRDAGQ